MTHTSSAKVTGTTNAQILETAHLSADSIRVQDVELQEIIDNIETDGLTPSKLVQRETIGENDYYILTDDTGQPVEVKLPAGVYPHMQYNTGLKYINWDVSSVTSGLDMFGYCVNLEIVDNNFKNLTNMSWMFQGCKKLKSVNLGEAKITSALSGLGNCILLETVIVDLSSLNNGGALFYNCNKLTNINLTSLENLENGRNYVWRMQKFTII